MKDKIQQLQQNSIVLKIEGKETYELCGTRFGGKPDVPSNFAWPYFEEKWEDGTIIKRPLTFLVQFNCEDLSKYDTEHLLPDHGILSFFYETYSQCSGFDPKDKGCARVFWFEDTSVLSPAEFPEDMEDDFKFPMVRIKMSKEVSYPSEDDFYDMFSPSGGLDDWEDIFQKATGKSVYDIHGGAQLLGWPDVIQSSMFIECDLVTRGYYLGNGWRDVPEDIRKEAKETAFDKWRLLLQLDTVECDDFRLMFGDCGYIYFYIPKEDLKAKRFDRIWLISQCC